LTRAIARHASRGSASSALAALLSLAAATGGAAAADWKWSVTPYVWASALTGDVTLHDGQVVGADIPFSTLFDHLEHTFQIQGEGRAGRHGVMADFSYVALTEDGKHYDLDHPQGAEAVVGLDTTLMIGEAGGLYNPRGDGTGFTLLYGLRVMSEGSDLEVEFDLGPAGTLDRKHDADDTFIDALVGAWWDGRFAKRWSWTVRADASAGGTDLIWSALASAGYSFDEAGKYTLLAGYRHRDFDFKTEDGSSTVNTEMTLSGFITGFRFSF